MYVIKIGGSDGNDPANVLRDLHDVGPYVLVHGGSGAADELSVALGRPPRYVTSPSGYRSRYTDAPSVDVIAMAMAGRVNVNLVAALQAAGIPAIGLSGVDGRLLEGRRKTAIRAVEGDRVKVLRDDRSGVVDFVNVGLLHSLLSAGYVPVISPPIYDPTEGVPLNADADRLAAKVASALGAKVLLLLTNVPGFLRDPSDPSSVVASIRRRDLGGILAGASGGMKKKLLAAQEALAGGVGRVVIGDSRRSDPVQAALRGQGTVIE